MYLTKVAPASVLSLAKEAAVRRLWENWAVRPLGSAEPMNDREPLGCWLDPILRLLGHEKPPPDHDGSQDDLQLLDLDDGLSEDPRGQHSRIWKPSQQEAGMLRAIISGGMWTPARLFDYGYCSSAKCPLCGGARCDSHHLISECPSLDRDREQHFRHVDLRGFPRCERGSWLWNRGLVGRSCFPAVPPINRNPTWHVKYGTPTGYRDVCTPTGRAAGYGHGLNVRVLGGVLLRS